jgi:hypothetical protein
MNGSQATRHIALKVYNAQILVPHTSTLPHLRSLSLRERRLSSSPFCLSASLARFTPQLLSCKHSLKIINSTMKLWVLLPIFVEVVLAVSSSEAYKHYLNRLEGGKKHWHHHRPHHRISTSNPKWINHDSGCQDTPSSTKTHHSHAYPPGGNASTPTTTHTPPNNPAQTHTSPTTTPTPSTEPPSTTTPGGNSGGTTSASDIQAYLDAHNTLRAKHGAAPLTWSDTLATYAQNWANRCVFEHSAGPYGENLVSFQVR